MKTRAIVFLIFFAIAASFFISGCGGINTVCVSSTPEGANLYVNGQYIGVTPKCFPSNWWWFILGGGDTNLVKLAKEGYKEIERTITHAELGRRYRAGDFKSGSEFHWWGSTFPYSIHLEPAESTPVTESTTPGSGTNKKK